MRIIRRLLILAAVLAIVVAPAASAAPSIRVLDPDDAAGRLDLYRVEGVRNASGAKVVVTISTHPTLINATLRSGSGNFLKVFLNTDGDASTDYVGTIYQSGTKLTVWFRGSGQSFENLPVSRPNPHTLRFTIPAASPLTPNGPLGMRAYSAFTNGTPCRLGCLDEAPNTGAFIAL